MKQLLITFSIALFVCGCSNRGRPETASRSDIRCTDPNEQKEFSQDAMPERKRKEESQKTPLVSVSPMPSESFSLHLTADARSGKMGAPYTTFCNVTVSAFNNTSIAVWTFPRITFYAEQNGEYYALRVSEKYSGGISAPYSTAGITTTLPRPVRRGKWNIFAVQEHSEIIYANHLREYKANFPLINVEDQDESYNGMWVEPLVSNTITVEFAEISPSEMNSVESFIELLMKDEQFRADFRQPKDNPTKGLNVGTFRWRSEAATFPDVKANTEEK